MTYIPFLPSIIGEISLADKLKTYAITLGSASSCVLLPILTSLYLTYLFSTLLFNKVAILSMDLIFVILLEYLFL